jgi:hypothetical protein
LRGEQSVIPIAKSIRSRTDAWPGMLVVGGISASSSGPCNLQQKMWISLVALVPLPRCAATNSNKATGHTQAWATLAAAASLSSARTFERPACSAPAVRGPSLKPPGSRAGHCPGSSSTTSWPALSRAPVFRELAAASRSRCAAARVHSNFDLNFQISAHNEWRPVCVPVGSGSQLCQCLLPLSDQVRCSMPAVQQTVRHTYSAGRCP